MDHAWIEKLAALQDRIEKYHKLFPEQECVSGARSAWRCRACGEQGSQQITYMDPWTGETWDEVFIHAMAVHNVHPSKSMVANIESSYSKSSEEWSSKPFS